MRIASSDNTVAKFHQVGTNRNGFVNFVVDRQDVLGRFATVDAARHAARELSLGAERPAVGVARGADGWEVLRGELAIGWADDVTDDVSGVHFEPGTLQPRPIVVRGRPEVLRFDDMGWRTDRGLDSIVDGASIIRFGQQNGAWGVDQAGITRA